MKNLSTIIFNLLISLTITSCGTLQYNVSENYITEVINNYSTEMPEKHTESGELSNDVFWDFIRDNNIALNSYLNNRSKLRKNATNDFRVMSNKANKFLYKTNEIELSNKIGNEIVGVNYKKTLIK